MSAPYSSGDVDRRAGGMPGCKEVRIPGVSENHRDGLPRDEVLVRRIVAVQWGEELDGGDTVRLCSLSLDDVVSLLRDCFIIFLLSRALSAEWPLATGEFLSSLVSGGSSRWRNPKSGIADELAPRGSQGPRPRKSASLLGEREAIAGHHLW